MSSADIFTNKEIVEYLLDETDYCPNRDLRDISILEPSAGDGAFAKEIIARLYRSSRKYRFDFYEAIRGNVSFYEINDDYCKLLEKSLDAELKQWGVSFSIADTQCIHNQNFLHAKIKNKYDCIVGNPPYIRQESIDEEEKQFLRNHFHTFKYRADLYIPFFERSLSLLSRNGLLSFICSNRWLYNQYGGELRKLIATTFHLKKLLNMERANPFQSQVLAYPCVVTIEACNNIDVSMRFCDYSGTSISLKNINFQKMDTPDTGDWQTLFLDYDTQNGALKGIEEQGFKIGIGIATGADSVFLQTKDKHSIEADRLVPIVSAREIQNGAICWKKKYLINPYRDGNLCTFDLYPKMGKYFNANKDTLKKRHTAQANHDKWYKTIDKFNDALLKKTKLLIPDFAGMKKLVIDDGHFYPHHSLYYIAGREMDDMKILASLLMSSFVRGQLSKIGICMHGGFPRLQAQTLRKIEIPNLDGFSKKERNFLINSYENDSPLAADIVVNSYCERNNVLMAKAETKAI